MPGEASNEVLIVGAGPTGMVLALWLTRRGVKVRIVDRAAGPGTTSRAMVLHARTLELYRQLDLADAVLARGQKAEAVNLWVEGHAKARIPIGAVGEGLTPYPYIEIFPQDRHEELLVERLAAVGVTVERQTELVDFSDEGTHVRAVLRRNGGDTEEVAEAAYLVGCDGARSVVRKAIGADFPGGTYRQVFYVADIEGSGPALNGEVHLDLEDADFLLVFSFDGGKRARLIGVVSDDRAAHAESLTFEDVSRKAIEDMKVHVYRVNWFSTYHVHHRVAAHFRKGRAFLAGDAGHIHSPVGGQGMNTGIGDAINLAWKLADVLRGRAGDSLLDSYETERIAFAQRLVGTTDRAFTVVTADGPLAEAVRTRLAPLLLPAATHLPGAREFMFRTVSQILLHYRSSPLSRGHAGHVHGGDRLPWAVADGVDNFDSLKEIAWQVHVYGTAGAGVADWCASHGLPLHVFAWHKAHHDADLAENGHFLLRPDTYVALATVEKDAATELDRYFTERGITLPTAAENAPPAPGPE